MSLVPALLLILTFPTGRLASPRWPLGGRHDRGRRGLRRARQRGHPDDGRSPGRDQSPRHPVVHGARDRRPRHRLVCTRDRAVLAGTGLVPRLRRSSGIERAQLKWITYVATLHALSWLVLAIDLPDVAGQLAEDVLFLTLALIPIAAGIVDPALPPVRDRRRHPPNAGVRRGGHRAGRPVRRAHPRAADGADRRHRRTDAAGSAVDAGHRRALRASAEPHPQAGSTGGSIAPATTWLGRTMPSSAGCGT